MIRQSPNRQSYIGRNGTEHLLSWSHCSGPDGTSLAEALSVPSDSMRAMDQMVVRRALVGMEDLRWWRELAPTLEWIFAKTYADTAPHSYVVHGRSPGLTMDDFIRAGRVIRTFGEPGKFYNSTNLYLYSEDRRYKYWAMWSSRPVDEDADLINCATTDRVYGPQERFDTPRLRTLMLPPLEDSA